MIENEGGKAYAYTVDMSNRSVSKTYTCIECVCNIFRSIQNSQRPRKILAPCHTLRCVKSAFRPEFFLSLTHYIYVT